MSRKCANCQFFKATVPEHCRRFPPRAMDMQNSAFPLVRDSSVCGEHKYSLKRLLRRNDAQRAEARPVLA